MILETTYVNSGMPKMVSSQLLFLTAASLCFSPSADIESGVPKAPCRKISHKAQTPLYRQLCSGEISTERMSNAPGDAE